MARSLTLAAAVAVALLAVSGAGGAGAVQTPKQGGTLVIRELSPEPTCLNPLKKICSLPPTLGPIADTVLSKPFEVAPTSRIGRDSQRPSSRGGDRSR